MENMTSQWKPRTNTGKTHFNKMKGTGESWTNLRSEVWGAGYVCKEKWVDVK
jgi:hypothetical protein